MAADEAPGAPTLVIVYLCLRYIADLPLLQLMYQNKIIILIGKCMSTLDLNSGTEQSVIVTEDPVLKNRC